MFPTKKELVKLYSSGKSMSEISSILKCSIYKVVYWMDKYQIKRRSSSEALYIKLNPGGDPFKIKENLTNEEIFLYGLGIGIYWGEGEKASGNAVRVANSDPFVIKVFIKFLREICQLKEYKIKFSIICFNDSNPEECLKYWIKKLKTSRKKFGKIVQIPKQGKGTYKRKSLNGVCTLTVCNVKLRSWIIEQIEKASLDSLMAKRSLGKGMSAGSIPAPGSLLI